MVGCRILREDGFDRKCQLNAQDCSQYDKSFGGEKKGQHAVFNVLDTMLISSLERLKIMRLALMSSAFSEERCYRF